MNVVKYIKQHKILSYSLQALLIVAVYVAVRAYTQRDLVHNTPPPLAATTITGKTFNLQTKRNNPLLVHFWASWCSICNFEQASIEALSKDYPVISIAMQSGDKVELLEYMRNEKLSFAVIADNNGDIARQFGIKAVPVSFILNPAGKIVFVESGFTSKWGLKLRLWLANFL